MRVDSRAGSDRLIPLLRASGVAVEEATLPAGDIEIVGNGPEGRPILIGIEYKTIDDVLACVRSGRFAEQLRGMSEFYEISWLLIEGRWASYDGGPLAIRNHDRWFPNPAGVSYQEVVGWALTMCQTAGVLLWRTETKAESVQWLRSLNLWWTAKDWDHHHAHLAVYRPPSNPFMSDPGMVHRVATVLPGLGAVRAGRVAKHFSTLRAMVDATEADWKLIPGVGPKIAKSLVALFK